MKNGICSKCSAKDVLRIPGQVGAHGVGNNIMLGWSIFSAITVTRYVCARCGFSEEWIDNQDDLDKLIKKYGRGQG